MSRGIESRVAPELDVAYWIDSQGQEISSFNLSDLGSAYKILYCFQDWCPGCHANGFPTLKKLIDHLPKSDFTFAAIQTVFEGAEVNTADKLRVNQLKYQLEIPFGQNSPAHGDRHPSIMKNYRTGGTPWFIFIDPQGKVIFNDFHLNAEKLIEQFGTEALT